MQDSSTARTGAGGVVAHKPHPHALPYYTVPDDGLEMGASLGNSALWVTTKGTGAIERVFSVDAGQSLVNAINVRFAGRASRLRPDPDEGDGVADADNTRASYVSLQQEEPGTFEINPAYQRHRYTVTGIDVVGKGPAQPRGAVGAQIARVGAGVVQVDGHIDDGGIAAP